MNKFYRFILKYNLTVLSLIFFCFNMTGCDSVNTTDMEPDKIPIEKDREFQGGIVKINSVVLKDGTNLYMKDKNPEIIMNGSTKVLAYDISKSKRGLIPLENIKIANVDVVKGNYFIPIAIVGGIIVFAVGMIFVILLQFPHH